MREVVAVVKGVFLKEPPRPTVYVPFAQASAFDPRLNWVVRGDLSAGFAEGLQKVVTDVDPRLQITALGPMETAVTSMTADSRFEALLFGTFAAIAKLLAAIGVFGLLSFSVTQRTHEIGTRIALGADRRHILTLILKQGLALMAVGLIIGIAGTFAFTHFLSTMLFGVRSTDPSSYVFATALLLAVGLVSYLPARHATRVDPMSSIRSE